MLVRPLAGVEITLTPRVRRAINLIKDRVAAMQWQVRVRVHCAIPDDATERMAALRWSLEEPNESDSLRTLLEQVLEDMLVGGFGAVVQGRSHRERDGHFCKIGAYGASYGSPEELSYRWR